MLKDKFFDKLTITLFYIIDVRPVMMHLLKCMELATSTGPWLVVRNASSRLARQFVIIPAQSSPISTILVRLSFVITSLVFSILGKSYFRDSLIWEIIINSLFCDNTNADFLLLLLLLF